MGKSTLCKLLADKYCQGYFVQEETENPYLAGFYSHMQEHPGKYNPFAYKCQMYFLQKRINNEQIGQAKIWKTEEKENNFPELK